MNTSSEITQLLLVYRQGDQKAGDKLFALVYNTLGAIAYRQLADGRPGQMLGTRDLVHEAYLKMFGAAPVTWQNLVHFFAVASRAMRQIIIDCARRRRAQKRGGRAEKITLDASVLYEENAAVESLELAVSELEDAILVMQDLAERLDALDPTADPVRTVQARQLLRDPTQLADAMELVEELEEQLPSL